MNAIRITCPTTAETVTTEIRTDAASFELFPALVLSLKCPSCGEVHRWAEMGGHLVDDPPKYP